MKKMFLLIISCAISLGALELAARSLNIAPEIVNNIGSVRFVDNPKMVYEFVPGSQQPCDVVLNKQGFNDSDFVIEKSQNLIRIAMLGDSITQGVFVPAGKTFSDELEKILNRRVQGTNIYTRYEVMNFGVGGYNMEAEVEVLKTKVLLYHPDIVILNIFFNDNEPIPGIDLILVGNYLNLTEEQQRVLVDKYVYNHGSFAHFFERKVLFKSKLYLLVRSLVGSRKLQTLVSRVKNIHGNEFSDFNVIYRSFREIEQLRKRHGFKFLICIHPSLMYGESFLNLIYASTAESFGFDYFHMISYYNKEGITPEMIQLKDRPKDNCHPNELGHSIIAKALFVELEKHHMLDSLL